MRNILVHGYFAIDLDVVWDAVQRDVPLLKPAVEALLKKLADIIDRGGRLCQEVCVDLCVWGA
jgi:uncharacterized protein YutE (UPF0331/DUF86 family)